MSQAPASPRGVFIAIPQVPPAQVAPSMVELEKNPPPSSSPASTVSASITKKDNEKPSCNWTLLVIVLTCTFLAIVGILVWFFLFRSSGSGSDAASDVTVKIVASQVTIGGVSSTRLSFVGSGPGWSINAGVPVYTIAPTARFSVKYINSLSNEPTIIHAHGQIPVPYSQDGVPFLMGPPAMAGSSLIYNYEVQSEVRQGTFFIHSHWQFQRGQGLSAVLITQGPTPATYPAAVAARLAKAVDVVMLIEDYCPHFMDEPPAPGHEICDHALVLRKLTEMHDPHDPNPNQCPGVHAAETMDVGYFAHLANGRMLEDPVLVDVNAMRGGTIRLRMVNSAMMNNYYISGWPGTATLISADGVFQKPIEVSFVWLAVAQRLDVLIDIPAAGFANGFVLIHAQMETVHNTTQQAGIILYTGSKPNMIGKFSNMTSPGTPVGFMSLGLEHSLSAFEPITPRPVDKHFYLNITGDNGFKSFNHKSYHIAASLATFAPNPEPLRVSYGDRVQIHFLNNNPDNHPLHLHGHTVYVTEINGQILPAGSRRDTVLIPGGCGTLTITFDAIHPGVWPLHCHMGFHLAAGMLTTVEYI